MSGGIDRSHLGHYATYRPVPSRKVVQYVIEVPWEEQEEAFKKLGYPDPDGTTWVAIARLDPAFVAEYLAQKRRSKLSLVGHQRYLQESDRERARDRAGAYPRDPRFIAWARTVSTMINVRDEKSAEAFIHEEIGGSRSLIAKDGDVYDAFLRLEGKYLAATGQSRFPEEIGA